MNPLRYVALVLFFAAVLYIGIENQTPPPEEYSELPAKVLFGFGLSIVTLFGSIAYRVTRTDRHGNPR